MNTIRLSIPRFVLIAVILLNVTLCYSAGKVVILSTNDIHGQIDRFPRLMTAINECRDTAQVILIDAGDKWTGNSYVDLVEHYLPIYELMNHAQYDFAVYGNHEFDRGQAYLHQANTHANFPTLGANVISDTTTFEQPQAYSIIERGGVKVAFVGAVGNYNTNNHPAGKDESFEGISFIDPKICAADYAYLKEKNNCDLLVLVTHMGSMHDTRFANSKYSDGYDMVIGAHSHELIDTIVNGVQLSQAGARLSYLGVTDISVVGNGEVSYRYRNIPLDNYSNESQTQIMIDKYYNNPELVSHIGDAGEIFDSAALRNLFASTICDASGADIGFYHCGGIRRPSLSKGDIKLVDILDLEPFKCCVCTMGMTTAQMAQMIIAKFNDKQNLGEARRVDMVASLPYTIITDKGTGEAVEVNFPTLTDGEIYKVAVGDYIYETYKGIECINATNTGVLVTDVLRKYISSKGVVQPDSILYQSIK
ncbi:MAG: 5'-nucleotidase C-terminal domain-containing protein [Bacteroidales bacterium]